MPQPGHTSGPDGSGRDAEAGAAAGAAGASTGTISPPLAAGADGGSTRCCTAPHAGQNFATVGMNVRHRVHGSSTSR